MWHKVTEQLPECAGFYRVRRRRPNGIIDEDVCEFGFSSFDGRPFWANMQGKFITSVVEWREDEV